MKPKRKKKKRSRRARAEVVREEPGARGATVATTDDEPDADGAEDAPDAGDVEDAGPGQDDEVTQKRAPEQGRDADERRSGRRGRGRKATEPVQTVEADEASEAGEEAAPEESSEAEVERRPGRRGRRRKATEPVQADEAVEASEEAAPEESSEAEVERRPGRRGRRRKATEPVQAIEASEELAPGEEGEEVVSAEDSADEDQASEAEDSDIEGEELATDDEWADEAGDDAADEVAPDEGPTDDAEGLADEVDSLADDVEGDDTEAAPDEEGAADGDTGEEADEGDTSMRRRKSILESLLFASDKPLSLKRMAELMHERQLAVVHEVLESLIEDYRGRGIELFEVAGGWQFRTAAENSSWVQQLVSGKPVRLSRAQLETMAIVAYRQPITRPEIDEIRGVDSGGTLKVLLDRNLIRVLGKKEEAGRPLLYGTTKEFLTFFNLNDLRELPTLREYHELTEDSRRVVEQRLGVSLDDLPGKGQIAVEGDSEDFAADIEADLAGGGGPVDLADEEPESEPGEGFVPEESEAGEGFVSEEREDVEGEGFVAQEGDEEGVVPAEENEGEGFEAEESEDAFVPAEESEGVEAEGFAPEQSEGAEAEELESAEESEGVEAEGFAPEPGDAGDDWPGASLAPEEASGAGVDDWTEGAAEFPDSGPTRVEDEAAFAPDASEGEDVDAGAGFAATLEDVLAAADAQLESDEPGGQSDDDIDEIAARVASEMPLAPEEDPLRTWPDIVAEADAAAPSPVAAEDDSATHEEG